MTHLPDLHSYLHQSSLLIQAYPTTRITTKYSLPRRLNKSVTSKRAQKATAETTTTTTQSTTSTKEKREPAATLTLKTYHADSGICLKYQTDKAQEVGRLLNGLGRLAKGEIIEMPSATATGPAAADDKMEVDGEPAVGAEGVLKGGKADAVGKSAAEMTQGQSQQQQQQGQSSGGGGGGATGKKKKKGGKK